MLPQYAQRDRGAEIALWLLITIGALLIPIIAIAICCIRRHWRRRPHIRLMENRAMMMTTKQLAALRSYNGPCTESGNDISSENSMTPTFKKQHVHWPDRSTRLKIDDYLPESPSAHRRPVNSNLSHFIQTAIIPAGSTVSCTGTSQFLTTSKEFTSMSAGFNSVI